MNVAYLRCSTNQQDVQHQLDSIQTYCKTNCITIDQTISEEGVSAYSTSYKNRKINDILQSSDKIDNLVVFEASRLSRNMVEGQDIIQQFTMRGTKIHRSIRELEEVLNNNNSDELFAYKENLDANIKQQEQLLDLYMDNLINKDIYSKRLNTLQENYNNLQQRISRLNSTTEQINERITSRKQLIHSINNIEIQEEYSRTEILEYISKIIILDNTVTPYIQINNEEFEGTHLEMY